MVLGQVLQTALLIALGLGCIVLVAFLRFRRRFTPVLLYHYFADRGPANYLEVSIESFRRQMEYLKTEGFAVVRLGSLLNDPTPGMRRAVITVDDADATFFEMALPVLGRLGYPVTVFAVGESLESGRFPLSFGARTTARWEDIRSRLRRADGLDVGYHSWTHPDLTRCSDEELESELVSGKSDFERNLGVEASIFAYPFGKWDHRIVEHVRRAGYAGACATTWAVPLRRDVFRIEREPVHAHTGMWKFRLKVSGVYSFVRNWPGMRHYRRRRWVER